MKFQDSQDENDNLTIEITSLIDVMFTLVLFFMVTTTFVAAPGFKVDLPKSSAKDIERHKKDLTIVIGANETIFLNQKRVSEKELQDKLFEQAQIDPQTLVIVQADQNITHGTVVKIMDFARTAGLAKLAIATAPKGQ